MEVSALRYSGGMSLHGRSPLLRLQSDERLVSVVRRGNPAAFEVLVSRYQSRLLAFCRHLLGSREDAEDVLQEVLAAAFNAILADERQINVRPWLYRIARNRCLNHLRRIQAVGVDSMDVHLSEHGASTADKVHKLEEFRMLMGDIQELPETQKTALVLREMDALSYEQIAEAMETTVPSVKSLLVRARVSLAEAAEARMLSCEDVRVHLAEVAEGLQRRISPLARRHLRSCKRCSMFQVQLKETNKALTALLPIGPFVLLKKLVITHIGHSAGAGAGSGASGAGAAGPAAAISTTAAAGGAMVGPSAGGLLSLGVGTIATKAAAGLAAAALVTAGAVEVSQTPVHHAKAAPPPAAPIYHAAIHYAPAPEIAHEAVAIHRVHKHAATHHTPTTTKTTATTATTTKPAVHTELKRHNKKTAANKHAKTTTLPGRTQSQTNTTVLATPPQSTTTSTTPTSTTTSTTSPGPTAPDPSTTSTTPSPTTTTTTTTTTSPPPILIDPDTGGVSASDAAAQGASSAPAGG